MGKIKRWQDLGTRLLFVTPVVLGSGNPLFKDIKDRIGLKLAGSKSFKSGVVLLCYEPVWWLSIDDRRLS
jgi:dihydrofolate reductase